MRAELPKSSSSFSPVCAGGRDTKTEKAARACSGTLLAGSLLRACGSRRGHARSVESSPPTTSSEPSAATQRHGAVVFVPRTSAPVAAWKVATQPPGDFATGASPLASRPPAQATQRAESSTTTPPTQHRSCAAAGMTPLASRMCAMGPMRVFSSSESPSHSATVPSSDALARVRAAGAHASERTISGCAAKCATSRGDSPSVQQEIVPSPLPPQSLPPSHASALHSDSGATAPLRRTCLCGCASVMANGGVASQSTGEELCRTNDSTACQSSTAAPPSHPTASAPADSHHASA
mmetsp:Transcript_3131/g.9451  ORF Transcript_3131/g.9451 Transcript_3131/m.9451 type:complete len:294 (+) Transcript_3131:132-1013(+)